METTQNSSFDVGLLDRICLFLNSRTLCSLLTHLYEHRDTGLPQSAIADYLEELSPENRSSPDDPFGNVRTCCARIRNGLKAYFKYIAPEEHIQIALPDNTTGVYKLMIGRALHPLDGAEGFWYHHFTNRAHNSAVFTIPMFFRIKSFRVFIRALDINDKEQPEIAPIDALLKIFPMFEKGDIVISRGFIPGAEVDAKDRLRTWFTEHATELRRVKVLHKPIVFRDVVSHHADWTPASISIGDCNVIALGSSRANRVIERLQEHSSYRYLITDRAVIIRDPTSDERAVLKRFKQPDSPVNGLSEDWSRESFVLVTRRPSFNDRFTATIIAANQGRGVHGVTNFLCNDDDVKTLPKKWRQLERGFPKEFQLIFRVTLEEQESKYGIVQPLLYQAYSELP